MTFYTTFCFHLVSIETGNFSFLFFLTNVGHLICMHIQYPGTSCMQAREEKLPFMKQRNICILWLPPVLQKIWIFYRLVSLLWSGQHHPVVSTLDNGSMFIWAQGLCSKKCFIHITHFPSSTAWLNMTYDVERAIKPQSSIHPLITMG